MLDRSTLGHRLRSIFLRWLDITAYVCSDFRACGAGASVDPGVFIMSPSTVSLGARSMIYRGCTILSGPGTFTLGDDSHLAGCVYVNALQSTVEIGRGVAIGPFTVLLSYSNDVQQGKSINESRVSGALRIGDDVFVGAGVVVLPGVTLADGAVVGAGTVVNHDVPRDTIVGGVPARVLGRRVR